MPGNVPNSSTSEDWRLLADEHAFFARLVNNSEELADKLVRAFLEKGEIDRDGRVRFRIWQIEARQLGGPSPYSAAFWQSEYCELDYRNNSAYWRGPASAERQALGQEFAEYELTLIHLNHLAVLDFLADIGLPPPERVQSVAAPNSLKSWLVAHIDPRFPGEKIPHRSGEKMLGYAGRLLKALRADRSAPKLHKTTDKSIAAQLYKLKLGPRE